MNLRRAALRFLCTLVAVIDGALTTQAPTPWRGIDHQQGA